MRANPIMLPVYFLGILHSDLDPNGTEAAFDQKQ